MLNRGAKPRRGILLIMKHILVLLLVVGGGASPLFACTGIYVGKKVSADGSTLIGRTVDTPPWTACFRSLKVPRGEGVRYAYVCTPSVTACDKGFFASGCANEKGLIVSGAVTGATSAKALKADPFVPDGHREADFPGLIAGNAATAVEALDLLAREIAAVGHTGAEIYMFADKKEAWLVEVYTGHQWAAVRMPEDKVACFGNQFMIRSFDPSSSDCRMSPDLIALAEKNGFLVCGADGLPDLYATYSPALRDYSNYRTWFGHKTLSPCTAGTYATDKAMPLFYSPFKKVSVDALFELMRSRYEATDKCPDEGGLKTTRIIGTTKQATSHVLALRDDLPDAWAGTVWTSLANSEHSVFLPVNAAVAETDPDYARDDVSKTFAYKPNLAGHAYRRLCALAEQNRRFYGTGVRAFWRQRERELLRTYPDVLAAAAAKGDVAALTDFVKREQSRALADARRIFDELMWYVMENNRIEGDGSGATSQPKAAFRPAGAAADDPADSVYNWWPARAAQKRREIADANGSFDLVFVGDSITHYFGDDKGRGVPVWNELRRDYKMLDIGYSGERTQNMIWRLEHGELDGYAAKAFVVMAGTNNAGSNEPEDTARGIARLVATIRERQPQAKVFLLAIFPRGEKPDDPMRLKNGRVNELIKCLADGEHVLWRDLTDRFLSADGTLSKDICYDFLHPTEKGYRLWAEALAEDFRQLKR